MRICKVCNKKKPNSEFYSSRPRCKACVLEVCKAYYTRNKKAVKARVKRYREKNKVRVAEKSRQYAAANSQHIADYQKQWRESHANERKAYAAAYYKNNPGRYPKTTSEQNARNYEKKEREKHLVRKFGIDSKGYQDLLTAQNGKCAICGTDRAGGKSKKGRFHVDHCHATGRVRGLLCARCNLGLGSFLDSVTVLEKAIDYLSAMETKHAG